MPCIFHKFKLKSVRSNFYGESKLFKCEKCGKEKVETIGWPCMGSDKDTKYTHYS